MIDVNQVDAECSLNEMESGAKPATALLLLLTSLRLKPARLSAQDGASFAHLTSQLKTQTGVNTSARMN